MKRISVSILFALLPLLLWGQGLNDGTFNPSNPDDPRADKPSIPYFSVDVLFDRAQFTVDRDQKNVTYEWTLDGKVVGTGPEILCSSLEPGDHTVLLTARNVFGSTVTKPLFSLHLKKIGDLRVILHLIPRKYPCAIFKRQKRCLISWSVCRGRVILT